MRRAAPACALLVGLLLTNWPAAAVAQDTTTPLEAIQREADALANRVDLLFASYIVAAREGARSTGEQRLADGRLLFMLEDYDRAATVFLDLVENAPNGRDLIFRDARFHLAESLYRSRNVVAAQGYFEEIIVDGDDPYRLDAVQRLLEIAFETRHYDDLEALWRQLEASGDTDRPDIVYIRAKTRYFRGDQLGAAAEFQRIPPEHELYVPARYFMGVCYAALSRWADAVASFDSALEALPTSTNANLGELADLTYLALGRIYYEIGEGEEALEHYLSVPRTSVHYDRALYESCWTYVQLERYGEALRALEIMMLAVPESPFTPQAQLLRGDLLLRMARYGDAESVYGETVAELEPLANDLAMLIRGSSSPDRYYEVLIDPSAAPADMPALARQWVQEDDTMRRALQLVEDLGVQARQIEESREIIGEIDAVLGSNSRLDMFPDLRQGYGLGLEIRFALVRLRGELAEAQADVVLAASAGERGEYERVAQRRRQVQAALEQLPQTLDAMSDAESALEGAIQALETEVFRQGYEIQTQRAQLVAIRLMIRDELARGERSEAEVAALEAELDAFVRELEQLEAARNAARHELEQARLQTGIGSVAAGSQVGLLAELDEAAATEEAWLDDRLSALGPEDADRIQISRQRASQASAALDRYFAEIDRLVDQGTGEIVRQLDVERALLAEYDRLVQEYGAEGERLAGEIAYVNFVAVQDRFSDLVLRADVGIIDVAWREKEERTTRIERLFDERNQELEVLDTQFREVLED